MKQAVCKASFSYLDMFIRSTIYMTEQFINMHIRYIAQIDRKID